MTLCKIEENRYIIIVSSHHILYDGWSNGIILKEFFQAYHALSCREDPEKPVKGQFKDFIKWLRDQDNLPDKLKEKQDKYWKEYLEGYEIHRPHLAKRKKEINSAGEYRFTFSPGTETRIDEFIKERQLSLSSLLYSAWGILLREYNSCRDVLFDATLSGRSAKIKNIENIVGLFINTLPLRLKVHAGEKLIDLPHRVKKVLGQLKEIENTSQALVKEYLDKHRNDVLFDSVVVIENYPLDIKSIQKNSGFSFHSVSNSGMTRYDLTVIITLFHAIEVGFTYNKRLFEETMVKEMACHFTGIVENLIESPGKVVDEIGISISREFIQRRKKRFFRNNRHLRQNAPVKNTLHLAPKRNGNW